jgi:hypothetical protein
MLVGNVLITGAETCAGNDGSAEIMLDGGIPTYAILWSNGNNSAQLENAAAGTYSVTVSDANGCTISASAVIAYECEIPVPPTQLMQEYCNTSDFAMTGTVACDAVEGADQYMWRVSTPTGTILVDEFTNDVYFSMANVPNLEYNSTYVVGIKARVNGNWGPFGNYCSVTTESLNLPTSGIVEADCGTTITSWGSSIEAIALEGVLNYEWHITGNDYDWTAFTADPSLDIVSAMQLTAGETYEVSVRCAFGDGIFTEWSAACTFTIAMELPVEENEMNALSFNLYPNPNTGNMIHIQWFDNANRPENLELTIRDAAGKTVQQKTITSGQSGIIDINFDTTLSSGFYVVTLKNDYNRVEKKMLVN